MTYNILFIIIFIILIFLIFLILLKIKLKKLEKKIIGLFKIKNNQIFSIYIVSKDFLIKHDEIFNEILRLQKIEFSENIFFDELIEKINTYRLIHNEYNFIFKVCNKNQKLINEGRYIYIKDIIIEESNYIGQQIKLYKKIIKQYNKLITIKNIITLGLLIPIKKIKSI